MDVLKCEYIIESHLIYKIKLKVFCMNNFILHNNQCERETQINYNYLTTCIYLLFNILLFKYECDVGKTLKTAFRHECDLGEPMCSRAKRELNAVFRHELFNFFGLAQSGSDYKI